MGPTPACPETALGALSHVNLRQQTPDLLGSAGELTRALTRAHITPFLRVPEGITHTLSSAARRVAEGSPVGAL